MPEVMQPDRFKTMFAVEGYPTACQALRITRDTVCSAKDKLPVLCCPLVTKLQLHFYPLRSVELQFIYNRRGECNLALGLFVLRAFDYRQPIFEEWNRLLYVDRTFYQVDILPLQSGQLSSAHAGSDGQSDQEPDVTRLVLQGSKKQLDLLLIINLHFLDVILSRLLNPDHRILL